MQKSQYSLPKVVVHRPFEDLNLLSRAQLDKLLTCTLYYTLRQSHIANQEQKKSEPPRSHNESLKRHHESLGSHNESLRNHNEPLQSHNEMKKEKAASRLETQKEKGPKITTKYATATLPKRTNRMSASQR